MVPFVDYPDNTITAPGVPLKRKGEPDPLQGSDHNEQLSAEAQVNAWHTWITIGPQGPLEDESEFP